MATNTINNCCFGGYLGEKPRLLKMKNGTDYSALSIATAEDHYDKSSNEKTQKPTWITVLVFGGYAKVVTKYLDTGMYVLVSTRYRSVKKEEKGQITNVSYFLLKNDRDALKFWGKSQKEENYKEIESSDLNVSLEDLNELDEMIRGEEGEI